MAPGPGVDRTLIIFPDLALNGELAVWISTSKLRAVAGNYTADAANPLVPVLFPLEGTAEAPKVDVQNSNDTITVARPGQDPLRFSKTVNGWSFAHP